GGDAIDPLPAMYDADGERAVLRRHRVDGDDLARHFADCGTPRRERGTGVAWLAGRFEIETRDRITAGDDAVIGAAGFRHQHVFVPRGLRLDDVSRRGRADFLVRREQHRDRQRRRKGGARQLPDRFKRQVTAALHVVDAGAEAFVALAAERQLFQRADRVNRIEMTGDQDSRFALFGVRKAGADATGKTLAAGDTFDGGAHDRHVARGDIQHAFDRTRIEGRAFALDPATQALQHRFGIKWKIGWIHRLVSRLPNNDFCIARGATRGTGEEIVK